MRNIVIYFRCLDCNRVSSKPLKIRDEPSAHPKRSLGTFWKHACSKHNSLTGIDAARIIGIRYV